MRKRILLLTSLVAGMAANVSAQQYPTTINAGTQIQVRTNDSIDVRDRSDGRIFTGTVAEDVRDNNGQVAIPRGANAELVVANYGSNDRAIDLESVSVNGRRYMVEGETYKAARSGGLGANSRTGKYVGGGALLGTIVGAIAGGGKGAAIGALAGGGAGAGTQVLTRGNQVKIPAETVLTFRMEQPLRVGTGRYSQDRGIQRDKYHYHDNYYDQDDRNNRDNRGRQY